MKIKRFVVFAGSQYYPCGGYHDYKYSFDTLEEAEKLIKEWQEKGRYEWHQIWDLETGAEHFEGRAHGTYDPT